MKNFFSDNPIPSIYYIRISQEDPFLRLLNLYFLCEEGNSKEILNIKNSKKPPIDASIVLIGKDKSPLHSSILADNVEVFKLLSSSNPNEGIFSSNLNCQTSNGTTPLILASQHKKSAILSLLLQEVMVDPNISDENGMTALHYACQNDDVETVKLLLTHIFLDPTLKDIEGNTPFDLTYDPYSASRCMSSLLNESKVVDQLLKESPKKLFRSACRCNNTELVETTHQTHASAIPDEEINACMIIAAEQGLFETFQFLINLPSIDVDAIDDDAMTALHHACNNGNFKIAQLLLDKGANPNLLERTLMSPLALATQSGHTDIVRILLADARVNINAFDANHLTPLHLACINLHSDIVNQLLTDRSRAGDECLNLNPRDHLGITPLIVASCTGDADLVEILLNDSRLNQDITDKAGRTALHAAADYNHLEVFLLLSNYYPIDSKTFLGLTPFHIACKRGHIDLVTNLFNSNDTSICTENFDEEGFSPLASAWLHNYDEASSYPLSSIWEIPYSQLIPEQLKLKKPLLKLVVARSDMGLFRSNGLSKEGKSLLKSLFILQRDETPDQTLLAEHLCLQLYFLSILGKIHSRTHLLEQIYTTLTDLCFDLPKSLLRKGISFIIDSLHYEENYTPEISQNRSHTLFFDLTPSLAQTLYHHYISYNSLLEIEDLLQAVTFFRIPIDINAPDYTGMTPLEYACIRENVDLLDLLLNQPDIDPNITVNRNGSYYPILSLASQAKNVQLVSRLLKTNTLNPNALTQLGDSSLSLAIRSNRTEIVELLLSCKEVDPNLPNLLHQTPLALASSHGSLDSLHLLLKDKRVQKNCKDIDASTPLHLAAESGHLDCAIALLQSGADPEEKNMFGHTSFHLACKMAQENIVEYFIKEELFQDSDTDTAGFTPLTSAWLYNPSQLDSSLPFFDAFIQPQALEDWDLTLPKKRHTLSLLAFKTTLPFASDSLSSEGIDFLTTILTLEPEEDLETQPLRDRILDLLIEIHSLTLLARNEVMANSISSTVMMLLAPYPENLHNPKVQQVLNPPRFTSLAQLQATFPLAISMLDQRALELFALLQFNREGILNFSEAS
jgi:ankyrin repeat protein